MDCYRTEALQVSVKPYNPHQVHKNSWDEGHQKGAIGFYQIEGIKRDLQLQAECATFNLEAHGVPVRRLND